MVKETLIEDEVRNALVDSGKFEQVQYIGEYRLEIKKNGEYFNIEVVGSLANLFV